jgi:transcriptional regulator of acetoin/glycerol metabolism
MSNSAARLARDDARRMRELDAAIREDRTTRRCEREASGTSESTRGDDSVADRDLRAVVESYRLPSRPCACHRARAGRVLVDLGRAIARAEALLPRLAAATETGAEMGKLPGDVSPRIARAIARGAVTPVIQKALDARLKAVETKGHAPADAPVDELDATWVSFARAKKRFAKAYCEALLRACGGNVSRAARIARMDRSNFRRELRR